MRSKTIIFALLAALSALAMSCGDSGSNNGNANNGAPTLSDGEFDVLEEVFIAPDAERMGGFIRLTESRRDQVGAVWTENKVSVADGFETRFRFRISDPSADEWESGADGLAFVIQDSSEGLQATEDGAGIGYMGIENSVAVEFDTYQNVGNYDTDAFDDPNGNHVSVQTRGTEANTGDHAESLGQATDFDEFIDGEPHDVKIVYDASATEMSVFVDDFENAALVVDIDLAQTLELDDGRALVGLTAATGAAWASHDILAWTYAAD